MELKMIVMDMDGTLLKHDQTISELTLQELKKQQDNGVVLVLASGRHHKVLHRHGCQLGMDVHKGYYIGVNGVEIVRSDTLDILRKITLSMEEVREIIGFVMPFGMEVMAVKDQSIYDFIPEPLLKRKEAYRDEKGMAKDVPLCAGTFGLVVDQRRNYTSIRFGNNPEEIDTFYYKICVAEEPETLKTFYPILMERFGERYSIARTSERWIELTPKEADKGLALRYVMEMENIPKENVLVFGDGENDLPLYRECIHTVAMGNGMESVKKVAEYVTESNENDGIGVFLKKIGD